MISLNKHTSTYMDTWLKHVFKPLLENNLDEVYAWNNSTKEISQLVPAAQNIYNIIVETDFNEDIDAENNTLANVTYSTELGGSSSPDPDAEQYSFTADELTSIFAIICKRLRIYWDESEHSDFECAFFKQSKFGKALVEADCFLYQDDPDGLENIRQGNLADNNLVLDDDPQSDPDTTVQDVNNPSVTPATSSNNISSTDPTDKTDPWKAARPSGYSDVTIDLKSKPHVKEYAPAYTGVVYKIVAKGFVGKSNKEARAFIKPIHDANSVSSGTNKVIVGQSANRGVCVCYFYTFDDAEEFLKKLNTELGNNNLALTIVSVKKANNGYFKVGTSCGDCFVTAASLNEDIEELEEEIDEEAEHKLIEQAWEDLLNFVR